jgi:hypothetical protein
LSTNCGLLRWYRACTTDSSPRFVRSDQR